MEDWHAPSQAGTLPAARRVVAFAPHPDDEVFGCGGALALYAKQGADVHVVVVSDGAAQVSADQREAYFDERSAESRAALACLGVTSVEFWGLRDRGLSGDLGLPERVAQCLADNEVDVVLAPSLWEVHPDHVAVGRAVALALRDSQKLHAPVLFYEVGASQRVNLLLDITPVWDAKASAMACFTSQQRLQDYARHISALNIWRTYTLPADVLYAEGLTLMQAKTLQAVVAANEDPVAHFMRVTLEAAFSQADAVCEALRQQLAERDQGLASSLAEFHRAMAQRDAAIEALRAELERALAQTKELHDRAVRAEVQQQQFTDYLADMQASTSWRVTAPLRWLGQILKKS